MNNLASPQNAFGSPAVTAIALYFVEVAMPVGKPLRVYGSTQNTPINFTFFWTTSQSWENRDFSVKVQ